MTPNNRPLAARAPLAALVLVFALAAGPALAQTPAPAAGVCVLDRDRLFTDTAVGKHVAGRMRVLVDAAAAELASERTAFEKDVAAFNAQRPGLAAPAAQQREQALQKRLGEIQARPSALQAEMSGVEQDALQRITNEAGPILNDLGRKAGCGAIFDSKAVFAFFNPPAMNLTDGVIAGLNAKITQIPVERRKGAILTRPAPAPR